MQNSNKIFLVAILFASFFTSGCTNSVVHQTSVPGVAITPVPSTQPIPISTSPPSSFTVTRQMLTLSNSSYSMNATFPLITGELPVYSLQKPIFTKEWVMTLAEDLGMLPDIIESDDGFSVNSTDVGKYYFSIRKDTGEISFQNLNGRSGKPQSPADAISSANTFLQKHNLMPADASDPAVDYNSAQSLSPSGEVHNDWQTSVLNYKRKINGLPVIGGASTLEVELDSNGKIIEIHKNWPEFQFNSSGAVKSPDKAFQDFVECAGTYGIYWHHYPFSPEKIAVDKIDLAYERGLRNKSNYLKPAYVFWGYGIQNNKTEKFSTAIIVSALAGDSGCRH